MFATLWNAEGVKICESQQTASDCVADLGRKGFWPRSDIPADITNKTPDPNSWRAPKAFFAATTCNPAQVLKNNVFVINTTLCGDLGNPTYNDPKYGCPGTCSEHVMNPANFISTYQASADTGNILADAELLPQMLFGRSITCGFISMFNSTQAMREHSCRYMRFIHYQKRCIYKIFFPTKT